MEVEEIAEKDLRAEACSSDKRRAVQFSLRDRVLVGNSDLEVVIILGNCI